MGHRRALRILIATTVLAMVAACSSGGSDAAGPSATPSIGGAASPTAAAPTADGVVALGDSYTAGPGIDPQQQDGGLCGRSQQNWATLLGTSLDRPVLDLSCSGATTADLTSTLASGSVPADAGLVTVSAGGNDGGLFLSLIRACTTGTDACGTFARDEVPQVLGTTTSALTTLLEKARSTAPQARVVLVGYPRIMPATGTCAAVAIPSTAVTDVVGAESALDAALASAARAADVPYVSLRGPSEGHDACAGAEAWTNGIAPEAGDGIVFHPNARGMAAIAPIVAAEVG